MFTIYQLNLENKSLKYFEITDYKKVTKHIQSNKLNEDNKRKK